jgi:hypothetical protein
VLLVTCYWNVQTNKEETPQKRSKCGEMRKAHKTVVGNSEEKGPLRILRRRCKDDIKTDLKGTGRLGVDWIHLARNTVQCLCVP